MSLAEEILEKAKKVADEAEVFWAYGEGTPVGYEANRLKNISGHESSGVALRIQKNGRTGFSSTSRVDDIEGLIARTLETVPFGAPASWEFPSHQLYKPVDLYDIKVATYPLQDMLHLGQSLIDRVRTAWPDVLWDVHVNKWIGAIEIVNSRGCHAKYQKTVFSMGAEGTLVRGEDMLFVWDGKSQCNPIADIAPIVDSLLEQLQLSTNIALAPAKNVPVIFTPRGIAGVLLGPLLAGLNGKNLVQGSSPLVNKLGEHLLYKGFSMRDDPTVPMAPGSHMCDDEGIPSNPIPLVENGVITNFLYDLATASQAKTRTTGSASRSISSLPYPSTSVIILDEGSTPYQKMVANIKSGLIVERLLGAGQGNILGGDFSANVLLGYGIENGQITGRVKDTMVSGNIYTVLSQIDEISQEYQWVGGYMKSPALCCHGVSVSAKT